MAKQTQSTKPTAVQQIHPTMRRFDRMFGRLKRAREALRRWHALTRAEQQRLFSNIHGFTVPSREERVRRWNDQVQRRTSNPLATRLKKDSKFRRRQRKNLLGKLRRLCSRKRANSVAEVVEWYANHDAIDKQQAAYDTIISQLKQIKTNAAIPSIKSRRFSNAHVIDVSSTLAHCLNIKVNRRFKNTDYVATFTATSTTTESGHTTWRNGVPKKYHRGSCTNAIRSFGVIINPQRLDILIHNTERTILLPEGFSWHIDAAGICAKQDVYAPDREYHPTATELLYKPVDYWLRRIDENAEIRELNRELRSVGLEDLENVFICMRDSRKAGNCLAGTITMARNLGLDPYGHYPATEIYKKAKSHGYFDRTMATFRVAKKRHDLELRRGFSKLSYHRYRPEEG